MGGRRLVLWEISVLCWKKIAIWSQKLVCFVKKFSDIRAHNCCYVLNFILCLSPHSMVVIELQARSSLKLESGYLFVMPIGRVICFLECWKERREREGACISCISNSRSVIFNIFFNELVRTKSHWELVLLFVNLQNKILFFFVALPYCTFYTGINLAADQILFSHVRLKWRLKERGSVSSFPR